jgi:putative ABC transport system ATP-binding protein
VARRGGAAERGAALIGEIAIATNAVTRRRDAREPFVLGPLDLAVRRGEWLAIRGASGAGKSTLLALLAGLDRADSGRVEILGRDVTRASESALALLRREHIGVVLQESAFVEHLTVAENVALRLLPLGMSARERARRAEESLAALGLPGHGERLPRTLSGGERRRVAIARALLSGPSILIADEPTSDLDDASAAAIGDRFAALHALGATIVTSTHDAALAARADRDLALVRGRVSS